MTHATDLADLRAKLARPRGYTAEPPAKRSIFADVRDTNFRAMAAEYLRQLEDALGEVGMALFVLHERLDEHADAGNWQRVAARAFYVLDDLGVEFGPPV